jgi:hypothetical protein
MDEAQDQQPITAASFSALRHAEISRRWQIPSHLSPHYSSQGNALDDAEEELKELDEYVLRVQLQAQHKGLDQREALRKG